MGIIPEQLETTTNGYGVGEEDDSGSGGDDGDDDGRCWVVVQQCKSVMRKVCCSSSYLNKEDIQNGVSSSGGGGGSDDSVGGADIQSWTDNTYFCGTTMSLSWLLLWWLGQWWWVELVPDVSSLTEADVAVLEMIPVSVTTNIRTWTWMRNSVLIFIL
jgi:hypothetical protein